MTASLPDRLRLALALEPEAMAAEVAALPAQAWVPHFNPAIYQGQWSGVTLRSIGGRPGQLYPDHTAVGDYADTELLASMPAIGRALAQLDCPLGSVRLLALGPDGRINQHTDLGLRVADGEARLHLPVISHAGVEFFLDGVPLTMAVGECWYLDLTRPHRAANHSGQSRVHLVVDCVVDRWLATRLATAAGVDVATVWSAP